MTRGAPRAALSREVGTGAAVTRGAPGAVMRGLGAVLSREVGTGATVTRGAPKLPYVRRWVLPEPVYCWLFLVIFSQSPRTVPPSTVGF
jgi:hypothetical protein